ncbi:mitochondrial protein Pet127-domain-containing protein [Diplogelasinospora grovesii]|uniref:Mitochondrial protein Pet127-domain-containing protein n=1 Tax=Diplogelasinospora grovesii TaxID=303347 RepID=A0AAN6NJ52_9PEZI|nr:mitochondrial protein Pet127-domain-containing protein [Diplogelasinospora grovesii]
MLQLGSRSSRTFVCTSCRTLIANASRSTPPPASAAAAAAAVPELLCAGGRPYSTKKKTKDNEDKKEPALPQPNPQPKPLSGGKKKSKKAGRVKPKNLSASTESAKIKLWRETLDVLKGIQAGQPLGTKQPASTPASQNKPGAKESGKVAVQSPPSAAKGKGSGKAKANLAAAATGAATGFSQALSPQANPELLNGVLSVLDKVLRNEVEVAGKHRAQQAAAASKKDAKKEGRPPKEVREAKESSEGPSKSKAKEKVKSSVRLTKVPQKDSKDEQKESTKKITGLSTGNFTVQTINPKRLELTPVEKPQPPVPRLSYGLDRVLFNPGVYHLQDPRSRVYNFDPYLARIMPIKEFDFNALKQYITSSKDNTLISMAQEHQKKYTGSTSSMTSMLSHFHYLLSSWRPINPALTSREFTPDSANFTRIMRAPAATFLHLKDGTYAIDADKEFDSANILSMLGKSMEKLLTLPKEEFEKYRRTNSDQLSEEEKNGPEAYHYTTLGDFMMRSQLDAYDPRVPGSGMFDLKTRAVISIRMDAKDFHKGLGYEIRGRFGQWESFEREYYDMIRSAFLKYSLQVRMGRMDGIFVAFHNTQRIFGFQYVSLSEMDLAIHGTPNTTTGDREFKLSLHLLNKVLDKATAKFPGKSLRLHFETRPSDPPFMYIFAKPVTPEEIEEVQGASRAAIEEFERNMMGVDHGEEQEQPVVSGEEDAAGETVEEAVEEAAEEEEEEEDDDDEEVVGTTSLAVWEDMMTKVEETLRNEEQGVTSVREAIERALEQSGLLRTSTPDEAGRYLDALLEAITDRNKPAAEQAEQVEEGVVSTTEEGAASDEREEVATVSDQSHVSNPRQDEADAQFVTDISDHLGAKEETLQEKTETPEETKEQPSLKDLILRLTTQVRTTTPTAEQQQQQLGETTTEGEDVDALKLRRFERILSELMAKNRQETTATTTATAAQSSPDVVLPPSDPTSSQIPTTTAIIPLETEPSPVEKSTSSTAMGETGETDKVEDKVASGDDSSVFGMILTVRNKVNGQYVKRPERIPNGFHWVVEYAIEEIAQKRADRLYGMVQTRRQKALRPSEDAAAAAADKGQQWYQMFRGKLDKYSMKGRAYRQRETEFGKQHPVHVYGIDTPLEWESVFGKSSKMEGGDQEYKPWTGRSQIEGGVGEEEKRGVQAGVEVSKREAGEEKYTRAR